MMSGSGFGRFFKTGNLSIINMGERQNIQEMSKSILQEICQSIIEKNDFVYKYANIFCRFIDMPVELFKNNIKEIRNEVEETMKAGKLKEIDKMRTLNNWFVEQEKLLDRQVLHPMDQQCQEMYSLLLRHADKSESFDARNPQDFRAFLKEVRDNLRVAKSQLEAYSSGEADISVKDNAFTALKEVNNVLKSLKGALNKYLSKIAESAYKIQEEFDQSYNKLLLHAQQSRSFTGQDPEEFKKQLERIRDRHKAAISQIENYLSAADNSEWKKDQVLKMLEKSLSDIKEIEKNLVSLFDIKSHTHKISIEIQQSYAWLCGYADQSLFFDDKEQKKLKEDLERIIKGYKRAHSCLERYLSGKDKDEANKLGASQELEKCLGEIKELERHIEILLFNKLNNNINQTYSNILKYVNQSQYFTNQQQQDFIENLEDMNRRHEQANAAIENYLIGIDVDKEKKYESFRVIEDLGREIDISLANQINSEIVQKTNHINKNEKYINLEEREQYGFKKRLEGIEDQRRDANSKLEPYFSGSDIREQEKYSTLEILEKCLEKTEALEIDMVPLLKGPMIQKIDQSYAKLLEDADKSPIVTKQELEKLDQAITDIKEYFLINDKNDKNTYELLKENFDKLSELERKMSLYLQLQVLRNNHVKVSISIENRLNNMANVDSEKRKNMRQMLIKNTKNAKDSLEKTRKFLKENTISMHMEYLGNISLNEYYRSIENLRKQASQLLGIDISFRSPR